MLFLVFEKMLLGSRFLAMLAKMLVAGTWLSEKMLRG